MKYTAIYKIDKIMYDFHEFYNTYEENIQNDSFSDSSNLLLIGVEIYQKINKLVEIFDNDDVFLFKEEVIINHTNAGYLKLISTSFIYPFNHYLSGACPYYRLSYFLIFEKNKPKTLLDHINFGIYIFIELYEYIVTSYCKALCSIFDIKSIPDTYYIIKHSVSVFEDTILKDKNYPEKLMFKVIYFIRYINKLYRSKSKEKIFTLPKELDTPKAKELLDKAIEYNLLEDGYKWNSNLITKKELAYLCYVLSNKLELSSLLNKTDEGRYKTNWKPFKELFNDNNLNNSLRGITTEDALTETMERIKEIYNF